MIAYCKWVAVTILRLGDPCRVLHGAPYTPLPEISASLGKYTKIPFVPWSYGILAAFVPSLQLLNSQLPNRSLESVA